MPRLIRRTWKQTAPLGLALATGLVLTGCSTTSGPDQGGAPPASSATPTRADGGADAADAAGGGADGGRGSGSFEVTGDVALSGDLTDVLCIEANEDDYVAQGHATVHGKDVTVGAEVPSGRADAGDEQESNSLSVGDTLYNRTSMADELLSGSRDGQKLTVKAKLVESHDPFDASKIDDHASWRTVVLTTHWDCGGQLPG
ncbi:hypothetical protein GCM10023221_18520 [Luteimicrobium xylanilyticum]|nr:hypothetical protein [Luteimicrobium xylanilyticum]